MRQGVLIISDDAQHRETMRLLLTSMGCLWVLASSLEEGIRILSRGPAAAVLDSGIASWDSHQKNDKLQDIVKHLAGRVILVFGETPDPQVMELARTYSLPFLEWKMACEEEPRNAARG